MLPYWALFGFFALGALLRQQVAAVGRPTVLFQMGILISWLAIGLRFEVGGDWINYEYLFRYSAAVSFDRAIDAGDPGYQFLNYVVARLGGSVVGVNVACSAIFCWGLYRFSRSQPSPWLAVLVAVPYLIVVVAMGYTRQATAIGILMAGLAALFRGGSIVRFLLYVVVAALFHRTAVVMLPFAVFAVQSNRLVNAIVGAVATALLYRYFLADSLETFVRHYLDTRYSSQGAFIRVMMSFVPAVMFFFTKDRLGFDVREHRLWWIFSVTSCAMLVLLFVLPSSTAVDRLALYLIPLQLAVVPRIARLFKDWRMGNLAVIAYAAAVLFIWLNFASFSDAWIPYRFAPLA